MAVFDRENAKIVVRVVYDGPGNAGKTTNIGEMCQFFTARRRSELISPEIRDGRTLWFDWLQIDGGLVAGYGLRCQIVTVPGQSILRRRRSALLRAADVVVLVCDSTPAGLELVRPAFGRLRQFVTDEVGGDVPIVVQANKQDLPGALTPADLAAALGADAAIPVIGARANAGVGVKETLVLAIRAAANRAQKLVLEVGLDALSGRPDEAEAVLAELKRLDDTSAGVLHDLLASERFIDDPPLPVTEAPLPQIPPPPAGGDDGAPGAPAARSPADGAAPPAADVAFTVSVAPPDWWPAPPLGDAGIAPGHLWPAATGREVLRRLRAAAPRPRLDLVAQHGERDGSGKSSTVLYDADGWCLKTSMTRRFDDLDAARVALVKLARTKIALGPLTLPGTVLVTSGDRTTGYWVWTFAPWRITLRSAMTAAIAARDRPALVEALGQFASAVVESLVRALRAGQGLDLHPSNFARDGDTLVYLDDEVVAAPPVPGAAHAILARAEELASHPVELGRYGSNLIDLIQARLTSDDLARLRLVEELRTTPTHTPAAGELRSRLLTALRASQLDDPDAPPPLRPPAPAARPAAAVRPQLSLLPPLPGPAVVRASTIGANGGHRGPVAPGASAAAPDAVGAPGAGVAPPLRVASPVPVAAAPPASALPPVRARGTAEPPVPREATTAVSVAAPAAAPTAAPAAAPTAVTTAAPAAAPTAVTAAAPAAAPVLTAPVPPAVDTIRDWPAPPTAAENLPSGFIWPVVAGRELVRQLLSRTPKPRAAAPYTYELGDYTLSTSSERRFAEVDDARAELLRLARAQVAGGTVQTGVVLVLAPEHGRGVHWIWTLAPSARGAPAAP